MNYKEILKKQRKKYLPKLIRNYIYIIILFAIVLFFVVLGVFGISMKDKEAGNSIFVILICGYPIRKLIRDVKYHSIKNLNKLILTGDLKKFISKKELIYILDKENFIQSDLKIVDKLYFSQNFIICENIKGYLSFICPKSFIVGYHWVNGTEMYLFTIEGSDLIISPDKSEKTKLKSYMKNELPKAITKSMGSWSMKEYLNLDNLLFSAVKENPDLIMKLIKAGGEYAPFRYEADKNIVPTSDFMMHLYDDINEVEETFNENEGCRRYYCDDLEADALPEEHTYGLYKFKEGYLYVDIDYNESSNMQIKRYKIISGKIVDENKINIILEGNITCDIYTLYSDSVYDIPKQLFLTYNFVSDQDIVKWDKTKEVKNLKISKKFGYLFS